MSLNGGVPMLALLPEGEHLGQLPTDPRRFMEKPMPAVMTVLTIVGALALSAGFVWFAWFQGERKGWPSDFYIGVVAMIGLICAEWVLVVYSQWRIGARRRFYRRYRGLRDAGLEPRLGRIVDVEVTQADSGTLERCRVEVQLDDGGVLRAKRHGRRALRGSDGRTISRSIHQAPQYGDPVAVFADPEGELPPLVVTQRAGFAPRSAPGFAPGAGLGGGRGF